MSLSSGQEHRPGCREHKQPLSLGANCCSRSNGIHLVPEQSSSSQPAPIEPQGRISPCNGGREWLWKKSRGNRQGRVGKKHLRKKTLLRPWSYTMGVFGEGRENIPVSWDGSKKSWVGVRNKEAYGLKRKKRKGGGLGSQGRGEQDLWETGELKNTMATMQSTYPWPPTHSLILYWRILRTSWFLPAQEGEQTQRAH